jgi:hypothetical protein
MRQFNRTARVTIGPEGKQGISFDERFRIAFRVTRTVGSEINSADVQIYGLSEQSRDEIKRKRANQIAQIEAGYDNQYSVLAIADITRTTIEHRPPDIVTSIECGDGARALRDRKINLSFEAGASVERVLSRVADELALGVRETGVEITGVYQEGVSFSGRVGDVLNQVTRKAGIGWSIQNRNLQILDKFNASQGRGVLLTPETGLLASPEPLEDPESDTERQRGSGFVVRCLLNPKIVPGDRLVIQSREVDGAYRVDTVEHRGDTRGSEWVTEAEVYSVET